jgi:hypothetical protein
MRICSAALTAFLPEHREYRSRPEDLPQSTLARDPRQSDRRKVVSHCDTEQLNRGVGVALLFGLFGDEQWRDVGHGGHQEYAVVAKELFEVRGEAFTDCRRAVALFACDRFRPRESFVCIGTCGAWERCGTHGF